MWWTGTSECASAEAPGGASAEGGGSDGAGNLAADAEGEVDRRAHRAVRIGCEHVERVLAGVEVLERESRGEAASGRLRDRRLAHHLVVPVEELDRHRRRLVNGEGERQEAIATEVTETDHRSKAVDRDHRR